MLKSKRKNVKELLNRDIEEVEFKIKQITQEDEQSDPYEYKVDAANTSKKQDNMRNLISDVVIIMRSHQRRDVKQVRT